MIGQLKPTGEGAGLQIPGWIIQQELQKLENKRNEVIDSA